MVKPTEVVDLQKLKQVHRQQFEADAKMLPEDDIVFHVNNVHDIVRVVLFQEVQYLQLYSCLVLVLLLVFDYFQCHYVFCLVVNAFNGL